MQISEKKRAIARQLQSKVNAMQGFTKVASTTLSGFEPFSQAFPGGFFPSAGIHEFISYELADAASTNGFITALAGKFIKNGGICLWVSCNSNVFPVGLNHFGLAPDRIVFVRSKPKDALWIIEEALKCEALSVVIGEIRELGFAESRRLQLAIERSGITGFIHRHRPWRESAVACTTRWQVTPLASLESDLPGIGHSRWNVQLNKVKNGRPHLWQVCWFDHQFLPEQRHQDVFYQRHTG